MLIFKASLRQILDLGRHSLRIGQLDSNGDKNTNFSIIAWLCDKGTEEGLENMEILLQHGANINTSDLNRECINIFYLKSGSGVLNVDEIGRGVFSGVSLKI